MSIKMKVMANIVKCVNFAEITMKQLGAPQFVMYTKEPGASREVDTTIIKVSLPLFLCPLCPPNAGLVVFVLIVLVVNLALRCDSGPNCGGAAEESCQ